MSRVLLPLLLGALVVFACCLTPPRALAGEPAPAHSAAQNKPVRAAPVRLVPTPAAQTSEAVRIALILTLLALIPAVLICMTPFVRIVVVLSMIRHAFGMPETPPNQVLISLALFLTAFIMMPAFSRINDAALQPFLGGRLSIQQAMQSGATPMRDFMIRQVHDADIKTVYDIAKRPLPAKASDVGTMELTTAFMLNELRVSFKIGFVILLPFLLIDIVVSSILLSLGMLMVPPTTLSLPIKVLMFVLIDGWSLVLEGVVGSFK
jgi:flagellar biosynthetic protein FliP